MFESAIDERCKNTVSRESDIVSDEGVKKSGSGNFRSSTRSIRILDPLTEVSTSRRACCVTDAPDIDLNYFQDTLCLVRIFVVVVSPINSSVAGFKMK